MVLWTRSLRVGPAECEWTTGIFPPLVTPLPPCGCENSLSNPMAAISLVGLTDFVLVMLFGTRPPDFAMVRLLEFEDGLKRLIGWFRCPLPRHQRRTTGGSQSGLHCHHRQPWTGRLVLRPQCKVRWR